MPVSAIVHSSGAYRYLPAIDAYSSGVAAQPGYGITGLRFARPIALPEALRTLDAYLDRSGLPATALAGLQLRSPAVLPADGFSGFNQTYLELLAARGLLVDGASPLSRTNVVPLYEPPSEPVVHAAFVVVPSPDATGDFVAAGSGEASGGLGPEHIVAFRDTSQKGLRAKRDMVIQEMVDRVTALGFQPDSPTVVNVYTAHDVPELGASIAAALPATRWTGYVMYPSRPPVDDIEFEMDCLRVSRWETIG